MLSGASQRAALALLACAAASAQTCAPGSVWTGSACAPCTGTTYSFGGAAASCAVCPAGSFVSSTTGCSPNWGSAYGASLASPSVFVPGSAASVSTLSASGGAAAFGADYANAPAGAISVTAAGAAFSTQTMPSLPTGNGPRALAAWVKCPASATGGVIMELGESSGNSMLQSLSLRATSTASAAAFNWPWYSTSTIAGSPPGGATSAGFADGTGTNAIFYQPSMASMGRVTGNIYVADHYSTAPASSRIRVINPTTKVVTTIAGQGATGRVDGIGSNAAFSGPWHAVPDPTESFLLVSDGNNGCIRYINISTQNVTTIVGLGTGSPSVDGVGTNGKLSAPAQIALDTTGNTLNAFYFAEISGNRIRRVSWPDLNMTTVVGSMAGTSASPGPCTDTLTSVVIGTSITGTSCTIALPRTLALDPTKTYLYWTEYSTNYLIRRVTLATGAVQSVSQQAAPAVATQGYNSKVSNPYQLAFNSAGLLVFVDYGGNRVIKISPSGWFNFVFYGPSGSTSADGTGTSVLLNGAMGIAMDQNTACT